MELTKRSPRDRSGGMKELSFFAGLAVAFYAVDALFGFIGCAIVVAILVLVERSKSAPLQS